MTINESPPSVMLSSSTMVGRIFGQGVDDECMFDIYVDYAGLPCIKVRVRDIFGTVIVMPPGVHLLVQLFEQPDVPWVARPIVHEGEPMIVYAPIEPLQSLDGRCFISDLASVTERQHQEGIEDRERQQIADRRQTGQ